MALTKTFVLQQVAADEIEIRPSVYTDHIHIKQGGDVVAVEVKLVHYLIAALEALRQE